MNEFFKEREKMKTLSLYKKIVLAFFMAGFGLALTACPDKDDNNNHRRAGYWSGQFQTLPPGAAGCPGCPATTNYLGAFLGYDSMMTPGMEAALELFVAGQNINYGTEVFAGGHILLQQPVNCNDAFTNVVVPQGIYQIIDMNQFGTPGVMDPISQLIFGLTVVAQGPGGQITVTFDHISLLASTPKLLSCVNNGVPYDELVATGFIMNVNNPQFGYGATDCNAGFAVYRPETNYCALPY